MQIQQRAGFGHRHDLRRMHAVPGHRSSVARDVDGAVAALGRAQQARARGQRRGAVRHRPGRRAPRPARRARPRACRQIGFDGYAIGGLAVGEPRPSATPCSSTPVPAAAGGPAALPDGRGPARGPRRGGGARRRHVRLRDADPQRPQRPLLHRARAGAHPQCAVRAATCGRSRRAAPATPAPAATAAPTCATWTAATRCWRRCWAPCTTCTTTSS